MRRPVYLLILAAMTAGAQEGDQPPPLRVKAPPTFSAFPASGVGTTGEACPVPNWTYVSENVTGTGWGTSGTAITITADYATAPDGTMTADRLEIPAISALGESVRYTGTGQVVDPATASWYVKGNGTTGTMDVFVGGGSTYGCASCAYNPTEWTRCSATVTGASSNYLYFGNESVSVVGCPSGTGAKPAHDVLVWGTMLNVGLTPGRYSKTNGAHTAPAPTGAKGEVLSASRASVAYCNAAAGGATLTTGIPSGSLVLYPNHMTRVVYGLDGALGAHDERASTNLLRRSMEFDNALWVAASAGGSAAPTVTSNYAVSPDSSTTAERVQVDACAANPSASRLYQGATTATGSLAGGLFCRSNTGVAQTVSVCLVVGASGNPCVTVTCPVGTSSRIPVTGTTATTTNYLQIGCINDPTTYTGSGNTGAADILVWGAQLEQASDLSSFIPTSAATASRVGDTLQYDLGASTPLRANSMCIGATLSGKPALGDVATGSYMGALNVASDSMGGTSGKGMWLYSPGTYGSTMRCIGVSDTTTIYATGTATGGSGTVSGWCGIDNSTVVGAWNGTTLTPSPTISGGSWSPARYITISGQSLGATGAVKSRIIVDSNPLRCRP